MPRIAERLLSAGEFEIVFYHHDGECLDVHCGLPAKGFLRLRVVSE